MFHFAIIFIFNLLISTSHAKDLGQVTCSQDLGNDAEIYKLLSTVKNDILGTLPKFCRPKGHAQLSDQNDEGEKSLSDFVDKLKKMNLNTKDALALRVGDQEGTDRIIFQTLRIVILKKMWNQSSEDNKYSLLLSDECTEMGLNRFPISDGSIVQEKNKEKAYLQATKVCQSANFADLAPFLSKDVLAESLLNLKNLFPQKFSWVLEAFCNNLSGTNELIFKSDSYSDFADNDLSLSSAKKFSSWLKDIYTKIGSEDDLKKQSARAISIELEMKQQKYLKEEYLKGTKIGIPPVVALGDEGSVIKKNAQGIYIMVPSNEKKEEIRKAKESYEKEEEAKVESEFKKTNAIMQERLKKAYEKGQTRPVLSPDYPGFEIIKDKNGKLRLTPTKALRETLAKQDKEDLEELRNVERQKDLKLQFEKHKKYADDDGKYYNIYGNNENEVFLDIDGLYKIKSEDNIVQMKIRQKIADEVSIENSNDPIPTAEGGVAVKNKNGNYIYKELVNTDSEEKRGFKNINKKLQEYVLNNYQYQTTDKKVLDQLPRSELEELKNYTSEGYKAINKCLRKENCPAKEAESVRVIKSTLKKIKKSEGDDYQVLFRGVSGLPGSLQKELNKNPNSLEIDKGFMSTTGNVKVAKHFADESNIKKLRGGEAVFIMKTKSCIGISSISYRYNEDEFLCPPGLKFKVRSKEGYKGVYILEEVSE